VIVNAAELTSGAQASITFDRTKVQVTSVAKGAAYSGAALFLGGDAGSIAKANAKGKLTTVAAAFLPPGTVALGDQDFLDIGFKATACGKVVLGLPVGAADASLLDGRDATYGKTLKPTTTGATVQICAPGTSPAPTPPGSSAAAPTPTPGGSVLAASSAPSSGPTDSTPPSSGPADSPSPSVAPSDSSGPVAIVASPSPDSGQNPNSSSDSGGPPWLLIGLLVVAVAAVSGTLLVRSRRT
jgi:hypothetical protein